MASEMSCSLLPKEKESKESIKMVLLATFVAVCGSFEFGSAVGYSSPAQAGIIGDLNLSLSQYSVFGSIMTTGAMLGAITSGRIADLLGRRGAMWTSSAFSIAGWVAVSISQSTWALDLGRLSTGFGVGIISYVVPVYIAEITPKDLRGLLTTVNQLMISCGVSVAYLLGTFLTWRMLAVTGIIPSLIQLMGLFFIPESPRWLAKVGQQEKFKSALQVLRGKNADISEEAAEIHEYTESVRSLQKVRLQDLFQRRYAHSLIVGVGLMVFQQFGGINGIVFYASDIFVSAGFSSGKVGTTIMAIIQAPMTLVGALLLDVSGRKPLLVISAAGTCIGCCIAGTSFFLKDHDWLKQLVPAINLAGILVYSASFSLGMGAIPWVIMSEIFPINIKGMAGSLVTLVNWFGSWAISYTFNFMKSWSAAGTFFIFGGICGATIVFVVKVVPETKGRTLEEIQGSLSS
ncbi:unnamed protein product [Victoria cruziana]